MLFIVDSVLLSGINLGTNAARAKDIVFNISSCSMATE